MNICNMINTFVVYIVRATPPSGFDIASLAIYYKQLNFFQCCYS